MVAYSIGLQKNTIFVWFVPGRTQPPDWSGGWLAGLYANGATGLSSIGFRSFSCVSLLIYPVSGDCGKAVETSFYEGCVFPLWVWCFYVRYSC